MNWAFHSYDLSAADIGVTTVITLFTFASTYHTASAVHRDTCMFAIDKSSEFHFDWLFRYDNDNNKENHMEIVEYMFNAFEF